MTDRLFGLSARNGEEQQCLRTGCGAAGLGCGRQSEPAAEGESDYGTSDERTPHPPLS